MIGAYFPLDDLFLARETHKHFPALTTRFLIEKVTKVRLGQRVQEGVILRASQSGLE